MPEVRPGRGPYVVATVALNDGDPTIENGIPGIAVKQKEPPSGMGSGAQRKQIAIGEQFFLETKGKVLVPLVVGAVKGSPVYINNVTRALALAGGAGLTKFGMVFEVPGQQGCPAGKMRVDQDKKALLA